MARGGAVLLVTLGLVVSIWGQMTLPPITPSFPPPPTFPPLTDDTLFIAIGQDVVVPTNIRAVIDCSRLIDELISAGGTPVITWFRGVTEQTNSTIITISEDRRMLTIERTAVAVGSQSGTTALYRCEVCNAADITNCTTNETIPKSCVSPVLATSSDTDIVMAMDGEPFGIQCGMNLCFPAAELAVPSGYLLDIDCATINATQPLVYSLHKDGVDITDMNPDLPTGLFTLVLSSEDDLGTYTFTLMTDCGNAAVTSTLSLCGELPKITGSCEPESCPPDSTPAPPSRVSSGDMTVNIGEDVFCVAGFDLTINCPIEVGSVPITWTWYREGVAIPNFNVSQLVVSSKDVSNDDGDCYECRVTNLQGFDSCSTNVRVFTPPVVVPVPFPTPPPGEIAGSTGIPTDITLRPGTTITLYCPATGIDSPIITWFRNSVPISAGGRIAIMNLLPPLTGSVVTSVLMITDSQSSDVGTYSCDADNIVDTAQGEVTISQPTCPVCPPGGFETSSGGMCPFCARWDPREFGPCSLQCHLGTQTRLVPCVNVFDATEEFPPVRCDPDTMPSTEQNCGSGSCSSGWRKGPWSMCTRTCETGSQWRTVDCTSLEVVVPDINCASARPLSVRFCNGHINCGRCRDDYPRYCRTIMGTNKCREEGYIKACCWSCGGDKK